jgi:hypothetical protein
MPHMMEYGQFTAKMRLRCFNPVHTEQRGA